MRMARFLKRHFMPPEEPDLPNYTSAQIQSLRLQAHTERNKNVKKLALDKPKLFAAILQGTSVASRLLIEANGNWITAKAAPDPNALAAIIRRTHFSAGGALFATVNDAYIVVKY
jgi:hypothetical protein